MKIRALRLTISFLFLVTLLQGCVKDEKPSPEEPGKSVLAVVNKGDNSLMIIDRRNYAILGEVLTGIGPHEITVNGNGTALVSNYGTRYNPGSSLSVIDIPAMKLVGFIDLPRIRSPHGLVFLEDGVRAAVVAEGSKRVLIVNIETGEIEQVMRTLQEMPHLVVLNEKKGQIFVSNIVSNTVNVYDVNSISGVKMLYTGQNPEGLAVSPDGEEVWIAERVGNSLSVVDTETLEIVDTIDCPGAPLRAQFTPDGEHVLVSISLTSEVAVFDADTRLEEMRIPLDYSAAERSTPEIQNELKPVPAAICIEPDSSRCYVASGNSDLVSVIDLTKWSVSARLRTGDLPDGIALWDEN